MARWRFVQDDDGHNYLIKDKDLHTFNKWETNWDDDDYKGPDFNDYRIDSPSEYSFTDPKDD